MDAVELEKEIVSELC